METTGIFCSDHIFVAAMLLERIAVEAVVLLLCIYYVALVVVPIRIV
jgi:hypothetical protein